MSLKEKVKNALKWKKNSEYCAERLGITEEEFDKVKKEIYAEEREKRKEEKNKIENDLEYIEKIAREKYKMVKPGEKIFKVVDQ